MCDVIDVAGGVLDVQDPWCHGLLGEYRAQAISCFLRATHQGGCDAGIEALPEEAASYWTLQEAPGYLVETAERAPEGLDSVSRLVCECGRHRPELDLVAIVMARLYLFREVEG
ncbi:hypothetical protein ACFXKW_23675 [Streptomyces sp. NPDC059193]|uniref:hypothetical protein n=1 Tax=Streptomyces sp. NPDC059193 TaxID=3346763 RepID=UPI0036BE34C3